MKILVISLLVTASVLCFVFAWFENVRYTRQLNALGIFYGCKRWPEEDNQSYHTRLRARIRSSP